MIKMINNMYYPSQPLFFAFDLPTIYIFWLSLNIDKNKPKNNLFSLSSFASTFKGVQNMGAKGWNFFKGIRRNFARFARVRSLHPFQKFLGTPCPQRRLNHFLVLLKTKAALPKFEAALPKTDAALPKFETGWSRLFPAGRSRFSAGCVK